MARQSLPFLILWVTLSTCSGPSHEPQPCTIEGVRNCRRMDDLLFAGQPSAAALRRLADQGFRTVLSTRGLAELDWDERAVVDSLGMTYVNIPMDHPITAIPDAWVASFNELMTTGERPMVLHCSSGNRVAGLWAVWLVEHRNVAPKEALRLARLAGMTGIAPALERRLGLAAGND